MADTRTKTGRFSTHTVPGNCSRELDEAHAALRRRAGNGIRFDPERTVLKEILFLCHYATASCGWAPPPLVQHGPERPPSDA